MAPPIATQDLDLSILPPSPSTLAANYPTRHGLYPGRGSTHPSNPAPTTFEEILANVKQKVQKKKPRWYARLLAKTHPSSPGSANATTTTTTTTTTAASTAEPEVKDDETYTLWIGTPNRECAVGFESGSGPFAFILHGNTSDSCEWWYLKNEVLPRAADCYYTKPRQRVDIGGDMMYEIIPEGGHVCGVVDRTLVGRRDSHPVGQFLSAADRVKFIAIFSVMNRWECGYQMVFYVLNILVDNGVREWFDIDWVLDKFAMPQIWFSRPILSLDEFAGGDGDLAGECDD